MDKLRTKTYNLLRKSEKFFKTDMVYLAKGGSWLFTGQIIAMFSGLILSIAMANLLPKESFGIYKFVLSAAGIIAAFSLTGMGTAIIQAVAKGFDNALADGFRIQLKWNIITAVIALTVATYYFLNGNTSLAISFVVISIFTPLINSFGLYASFLQGKKDFRAVTFYGTARNIITPIFLIGTIALTNNPIIVITAYYLAYSTILGVLYSRTIKYHTPKKKTGTDFPLLHNSRHLSAINILRFIAGSLDKILVFHYLGAIELAIYAFAIAPVDQIRSLNKIIKTLIFPKLVQSDIPTIKKTIPRKALIFFVVIASIMTLYIFSAPYIYMLLFPQYIGSVIFSQIFALTLLFSPILFFKRTFLAHMKKKELYITQIVTPTVKIILLFALLPIYGIWGAIFAIIITHVVQSLLTIYLFKKL